MKQYILMEIDIQTTGGKDILTLSSQNVLKKGNELNIDFNNLK